MDKKRYTIEFLYDNGLSDKCLTNKGTKDEISEMTDYLLDMMKQGATGGITLEGIDGNDVTINFSKVTRFKVIN